MTTTLPFDLSKGERPYYGTKVVTAWPQDKQGAEDDRPVHGYGVRYEDGYESWSPKEVFQQAYQAIDALSFGHAVEVLKRGGRVARAGWNGKNMFLWMVRGDSYGVMGVNSNDLRPWIGMLTADGSFVPWLASQTDILANDWHIVGAVQKSDDGGTVTPAPLAGEIPVESETVSADASLNQDTLPTVPVHGVNTDGSIAETPVFHITEEEAEANAPGELTTFAPVAADTAESASAPEEATADLGTFTLADLDEEDALDPLEDAVN